MKIKKTKKQKAKLIASTVAIAAVAVPVGGYAISQIGSVADSYAEEQEAVAITDQNALFPDDYFEACVTANFLAEYPEAVIGEKGITYEQTRQMHNLTIPLPNSKDCDTKVSNSIKNVDGIGKYMDHLENIVITGTSIESLSEEVSYIQTLQSLDVSGNQYLRGFTVRDSQSLKTIKTHDNPALEYVQITENPQLENLEIANTPLLSEALITHNALTSIDLSTNTNLQILGLMYNKLTDVDVSHNKNLQLLGVSDNKLTSIDVSNNKNLQALAADDVVFVKSGIMTDQMAGAKDFDLSSLKFIGEYKDESRLSAPLPSFVIGNTIPSKSPIYTFDETTRMLSVKDLESTIDETKSYGYVQTKSLPQPSEVNAAQSWVQDIIDKFTYKLVLFEAPQPDVPVPHTGGETAGAPNTGFGSAATIATAASIAVPTLIASLLVTRAIRNRKRGHLKFD